MVAKLSRWWEELRSQIIFSFSVYSRSVTNEPISVLEIAETIARSVLYHLIYFSVFKSELRKRRAVRTVDFYFHSSLYSRLVSKDYRQNIVFDVLFDCRSL